jgi:formylglycine-generating enzyme required for sulfatase activity
MMIENTLAVSLIVSAVMLTGASYAEESLVPKDMVYVSHGPSVMGLDKEAPAESGKRLSAYDRRMKTPWSAEALNDEGPAHMVFLDSYLIDKYETSNKEYGDFLRATGHPAPAYWDDPRLNNAGQPVVGVNWEDATVFCGYRGTEAASNRSGMGEGGSWSQGQSLSMGQ